MTQRKTLTPVATAQLQQALSTGTCDLTKLMLVSGLPRPVVARYVRELRAANMVHVADWDRDRRGYPTIQRFSWGNKKDAPCPVKTRTDAERMRALRESRKSVEVNP